LLFPIPAIPRDVGDPGDSSGHTSTVWILSQQASGKLADRNEDAGLLELSPWLIAIC
jgi:hypothetical protein